MKKIHLILLALFGLIACNPSEKSASGFRVKGTIKNHKEGALVISELTPKGLIFLDSAVVQPDGSFELSGSVTEPTFAIINLPNGAVAVLLDTLSELTLSVDAEKPELYGVSGSDDSELLKQLLQINNKYMQQTRNLEQKYASSLTEVPGLEVQQKIRSEFEAIMSSRKSDLITFANQHNQSLVPYFLTNFLLPEADFAFFDQVDKALYTKFPTSKYAQEHHVRVEKLRKTAEGQQAPDIVLNDPYGKTIALSSLRGKYVLIDFWASWCRPCREESPNLVRMYNKYKNRGFEIFSVSLDDNRDAWMKAINDDKLLWTHVSDLQKWNASVVSQYNIEGIPLTILLDKDGNIIGKNLRGNDLEVRLSQLFPN